MVIVIFRAKAKQGKEQEALAQMRSMVESVQAQEPGALAYMCHTLKDDPAEVVFYEAYADDAAFKAHMETPHMSTMRGSFAELFDTTQVKLERLDEVAGFMRNS